MAEGTTGEIITTKPSFPRSSSICARADDLPSTPSLFRKTRSSRSCACSSSRLAIAWR